VSLAKRSQKSHYRGLTREQAHEIRRRYLRREANQPQLAREYGRSQPTISKIVSGKVWA